MRSNSVEIQPSRASIEVLDGAPSHTRRVCVVSEDLSGPPDEGVKKFVLSLAEGLQRQHEVALISTQRRAASATIGRRQKPSVFLSRQLRRELIRQRPEILIYAARASTTFMAFVRSWFLKRYRPKAVVVLVGLQARHHARWQQRLIPYLAPDLVCVQSPQSQDYLAGLGCHVVRLPSGVDLDRFQPVTTERRRALRLQMGLRPDLPVVLHVGHLKAGRGVGVLAELARRNDCQVVLVASSSTAPEEALGAQLRQNAVTVLTTFQPEVEQLYQMASCYVFPVESTDNAIEVPLSILEAFACDLPVATTRFAGLPRLFGGFDHTGLVFVDSARDLPAAAARLCQMDSGGTRVLALPFSWERVAAELIDQVSRREVLLA